MVPLNIKLPDVFLEEEDRCGYTVTKQMKELWAVLLDILVQIQNICDKHGIEYVATGGTLLGAVRHGGFIPWDDDIDLAMTRKNYQRFRRIAEKELTYPYFLQTETTDPSSIRRIAKVMRLDTTAILKSEINRGFSYAQGIFVDIFPLDNIPDDTDKMYLFFNEIKQLNFLCHRFRNRVHNDLSNKNFLKSVLGGIVSLFNIKNKYYFILDRTAQKFNDIETEFCGEVTFDQDFFINRGKTIGFKKSELKETKDVKFEFLMMKIPVMCEDYLARYYGNWREYEIGTSLHGELLVDTDKSYKDYLNKFKKSK